MGLVYKRESYTKSEGYVDANGNPLYALSMQQDKFALQYPITLDSSPEFGGNKVVFFINVSGNSKTLGQGSGQDAEDYRGYAQDLPPNEFYKA